MKTIDIKSMLIGVLFSVCLFLIMGQTTTENGRFDLITAKPLQRVQRLNCYDWMFWVSCSFFLDFNTSCENGIINSVL